MISARPLALFAPVRIVGAARPGYSSARNFSCCSPVISLRALVLCDFTCYACNFPVMPLLPAIFPVMPLRPGYSPIRSGSILDLANFHVSASIRARYFFVHAFGLRS